MPVSISTARDPFRGTSIPPRRTNDELRVPQARLLAALIPTHPSDPPSEWPIYARPALAIRAGYTPISGTVTRALNGIRPGSTSGDAHPGLIDRGLVEVVMIDVDGLSEANYRATTAGLQEYATFIARVGALPPLRDAGTCTNARYRD